MTVEVATIFGSPNIGVYVFANNKLALLPPDAPPKLIEQVREVLKVEEIVLTTLAGSRLLGVFTAGNDNGLILPRVALDNEIELLLKHTKQAGLNLEVLRDLRETGVGNLILANGKGCLMGSILPKNITKVISDVLGVECLVRNIADLPLVGSLAVATNLGLALPPLVTEEELEELSSILRVPARAITVNRGKLFLRAGLVANDKGAIAGGDTTGIELMQIQRALFP
uniref:Translation initiation factor 6 n=1 Tax=Thermofilum pendens TaxID=2269 RepID=A0A7C4B9D4_THEPE